MQDQQQTILSILLLVYAVAVLINTAISGLLYARQRDDLTRAQLLIWASTFAALVAQGLSGPAMPWVLVGLTAVFLVSYSIARLLSRVSGVPLRRRRYLALLGAGWLVALPAMALKLPFAVVTLPVLIGVAFPLLSTSAEMLAHGRGKLSPSELGMGVASAVYGVHMLDFALLGDKPAWAPIGFSIGLLSIFALSIFAPAVVVEKITTATARTAAEMDAARRIQTQILPQSPAVPGLDLACYMKPADEVGGDYYDIQEVDGRSWILLGDVTGHGLPSGLVMLMAQSVMSSILHTQPSIGPAELNLRANRILRQNLERLSEDRTMTIASLCKLGDDEFLLCGSHDNLFVHRKQSGEVEVVEVSQFPFQLGLVDEVPGEFVSETRLRLGPGDTLFVITDGVTEAAEGGDYKQGLYNEERLVAFIRATAGRPVDTIKSALVQELDQFTRGVYHDDVTFIIARRQEAA